MVARGVKPIEPYPGANRPWRCKCLTCGSEVTPRYTTVVTGGRGGCNPCAKKQSARTRYSTSEAEYIKAAEELHLKPLEPYPGAQGFWLLKCTRCGDVKRKKAQGVKLGKGCQHCSSNSRGQSQRRASKPRADQLLVEAGLTPEGPYLGMGLPYLATCNSCGNKTSPTPQSIAAGSGGCWTCSIPKRASTKRDSNWTDQEARELMLKHFNQISPEARYPGMTKSWPGKCLRCGLPTKSSVIRVMAGSGACKTCSMSEADSAFDYFAPAVLYFLFSERFDHFKVGIMGTETRRLEEHSSNGWTVLQTWHFEYGYEANYVEQYVLQKIHGLGFKSGLRKSDLPQGGHTETFENGLDSSEVTRMIQEEIELARWPIPLKMQSGLATAKARRTCTVIENGVQCTAKYYSNGCCHRHVWYLKAYGDPLVRKKQVFTNAACEVNTPDGVCGKPVSRKGMCSVHYHRDYEYGDPNFTKRPTPMVRTSKCSVAACEKEDYSLGFCSSHYHANRKRNRAKPS